MRLSIIRETFSSTLGSSRVIMMSFLRVSVSSSRVFKR